MKVHPKSVRIAGLTLIEILVSLSLLGVIMAALFQTMGSTVALSNTTTSSNDLIREGQIAQQVLNARFKEACYVYPTGETIKMTSIGFTTKNGIGWDWVVNTDPIVAFILPPEPGVANLNQYRFQAYYAIPRSQYVNEASNNANPGKDAVNDSSVWMLMEYRKVVDISGAAYNTGRKCAQLAVNSTFKTDLQSASGRLLTDYITPVTTSTSLMSVGGTAAGGGAAFIEYNLRLQQTTRAGNIISVGGGSSGTNLTAKVYPVNLGL